MILWGGLVLVDMDGCRVVLWGWKYWQEIS